MHLGETPGETLEIPIGVGNVGPTAGVPTPTSYNDVYVGVCGYVYVLPAPTS